jgi:hypothetical protein
MENSTDEPDEQAIELWNKLVEYYGDNLPSFEHEPIQFEHCVKLYRYYN